MLKASCNHGDTSVEVNGSMGDILCELSCIVSCIYEEFYKDNPFAANLFKVSFCEMLTDAESSLWKLDCDTPKDADVKFGVVDLNGCKNAEDAKALLKSMFKNMGIPEDTIRAVLERFNYEK